MKRDAKRDLQERLKFVQDVLSTKERYCVDEREGRCGV
jgi:hypothetical protein